MPLEGARTECANHISKTHRPRPVAGFFYFLPIIAAFEETRNATGDSLMVIGKKERRAEREQSNTMKQDLHLTMIEARLRAGLTQGQLARQMRTSRSTISRIESGRDLPLVSTLERLAEVTGHRLEIRLVPSRKHG